MTKTTKPITREQVLSALRTLIRTQPDTVNPLREGEGPDGVCAYFRGRGRNIRRCIGGQIGYDFGLPTPPAGGDRIVALCGLDTLTASEDTPGFGLWEGRLTPSAASLLNAAQALADGGWKHPPQRWGDLTIAAIEQHEKTIVV